MNDEQKESKQALKDIEAIAASLGESLDEENDPSIYELLKPHTIEIGSVRTGIAGVVASNLGSYLIELAADGDA